MTDEERKEKARAYAKRYRTENPEKVREVNRLQREKNRERNRLVAQKWREANRERHRKVSRDWYDANKERSAERHLTYITERLQTDPEFRLRWNLRSRIRAAVKGRYKSGSAVDDLGCSIPRFIEHITEQFQPGMTWENYGEWHLDHIIPLASYDLTDYEQFVAAAHYTNYQPLWAADNLKKGCSRTWKAEEPSE